MGLLGLLLAFAIRKPLTGGAIEWVLNQSIGLKTKVRVETFAPQTAEIDVTLLQVPLRLPRVRVEWWLRKWFPPRIEALATIQEKNISAVGLVARDLTASLNATVEGIRITAFQGEAVASEVAAGELGAQSLTLSLVVGHEGVKARASGRLPWGKTEAKFDGPPLKTEDEIDGKGRFLASWPKGRLSGTTAFHFDSGFKQGTAQIDGLSLDGKGIPEPLKAARLSARFEKKEKESRLVVNFPAVTAPFFQTSVGFPLEVAFSESGVYFSGSVRGNPWIKTASVVADGLELSGQWLWAEGKLAAHGKIVGAYASGATLPVELKFETEGTLERAMLKAEAADLLGDIWMTSEGEWTPKQGLDMRFGREFAFADGKFDPSNVVDLGDSFESREGTLGISGRARWKAGSGPSISATIKARGLSFDFGGVPCEKLDVDFAVAELFPLRLAGKATARFERLGSILPLHQLDLVIAQKGHQLQVERLLTNWGDGHVNVEPFPITLDPLGFDAFVVVQKVDAESLLKEAAAGQIKAKGVLVGRIPITWKDGYLWVKSGLLSSGDTSGWIQYKDPTLVGVPAQVTYLDQFEDLLAQGQQALAFKALDNFFFKSAQIRLERTPSSGLEAYLTLSGHNPDLANGMPFQFQIALTGQVETAVKQSLLRGLMRPEAFTDYLKNK